MSCGSQGAQSRVLLKAGASPYTWTSGAFAFEFNRETIKRHGRIVGGRGIRGTRSKPASRMRVGAYAVGGSLSLDPSPNLLDTWLPYCLGANESTDVFALAETLPSFGLLFNRVGGVFEYQNGYVDKWAFEAQAGPSDSEAEIVTLETRLMFRDESTSASWPESPAAIGAAAVDNYYVLSDLVATISGSARKIARLRIMGDNHLQPQWTNSLSATCITPRDRTVTVAALVPFTSTEMSALYGNQVPGAAASFVFTNGAYSATIAIDQLAIPPNSPTVQGKQEIYMWLVGTALKDDADEISITNDSTGS